MSTIFRLDTSRNQWKLLGKQLTSIAAFWVVWLLSVSFILNVDDALRHTANLIFISVGNFYFINALWSAKRLFGVAWNPKTIFYGIFTGVVLLWALYLIFKFGISSPVSDHNPLFQLLLNVLLIGNGFLFLTTILWFFLNTEKDNTDYYIYPFLLTTSIFLLVFILNGQISIYQFSLCIISVILIFGTAFYLHQNPRKIYTASTFYQLSGFIPLLFLAAYLILPLGILSFSVFLVFLSISLLLSYLGLIIHRYLSEERLYLFDSSELLHTRLTGNVLIVGLIIGSTVFMILPLLDLTLPKPQIIYSFYILLALTLTPVYFVSRKATAPLQQFREGLQKITSGSFDTLIPVETKDEVGELAHAYNMMVYRLQDLQNELASTERQAAFSEMARQVAHEIKNPLTPMKLKIQHLQRSFQSGKTTAELSPLVKTVTAELIDQIESLDNIARSFSKYAKPITSDFENADLNELIDQTLTLYRHEDKAKLLVDHADNPLICHIAKEEWKRIIINLINNSAEAMPNGGVIIIRLYPHKDRAYVEVVDNGDGISVEDKPKIFTPNFSTKSSGTGLGLAITKKLVEAMKGDIQFASAKGAGTTFTLSFPLSQN